MSDILQTILSRAELQHSKQNGDAEFLPVLLQQTVAELTPERLSVWFQNGQSSQLLTQIGQSTLPKPSDAELQNIDSGGIRLLGRQSQSTASQGRQLLAASLVAADSQLVLEFVEGSQDVEEETLVQLTDVFADLQRRRMLESLLQASRRESAWQVLTAQVHASLDPGVITNTIATDTAAVLPCHRIAVGRRQGGRWEVVATTGVSQPNPRSDASRRMSAWMEAAADGTAPAEDDDQNRMVRPLHPSGNWGPAEWAVVVETDQPLQEDSQLNQFLQQAAVALENCEAVKRHTLVGLLRSALRSLRRARTLVTVGVVAAALLLLILVPTDLRIEVYGELVPTQRSFVFAPDDGTITELHVEDDATVSDQDLLCVLINEDLNVQAETIDGELAAANARLAAIAALRGGQRQDSGELRLLSAEQAELEERLKSLTKQSAIVASRLGRLSIRCPMDGRVYGDRLRQTLLQRPVQRGQYLMEVADPSGGWQLHLRVPEADVRYVLQHDGQNEAAPSVSYSLETSPEITRQTVLTSLGASTDVDSRGNLSTLAIADVEHAEFARERPGAGVVARIHCGRRAVGFVWFRQLIEFVQRRLWW